jgi:hypothetical protein
VSGNAFIYNLTTHQWTLLQLGGSLSSQTTLYGIWQNGGPGSPNYTLAGGSAAHGSSPSGAQRAFLMNYNERTGRFGKAEVLQLPQRPGAGYPLRRDHRCAGRVQPRGHQLGSGLVPGVHPGHRQQLAVVRQGDVVSHRCRGKPAVHSATGSELQHGNGNTVYQNQVMGLYVQQQSDSGSVSVPGTYLATVTTLTATGPGTPRHQAT